MRMEGRRSDRQNAIIWLDSVDPAMFFNEGDNLRNRRSASTRAKLTYVFFRISLVVRSSLFSSFRYLIWPLSGNCSSWANQRRRAPPGCAIGEVCRGAPELLCGRVAGHCYRSIDRCNFLRSDELSVRGVRPIATGCALSLPLILYFEFPANLFQPMLSGKPEHSTSVISRNRNLSRL